MKTDVWEITANINTILHPLRETEVHTPLSMDDSLALRSKLRAQLERLRIAISEQYSERDAYFVLFPLMAHCDELAQCLVANNQIMEWPSLQKELYQVMDAGDLFYELLDSQLSKPESLPLVYEMFYFCLKDGFRGRYSGNSVKIAEYLQQLQKHIYLPVVDTSTSAIQEQTKGIYFRIPNSAYYGTSGVLLLLIYWFLGNLADTWQPM